MSLVTFHCSTKTGNCKNTWCYLASSLVMVVLTGLLVVLCCGGMGRQHKKKLLKRPEHILLRNSLVQTPCVKLVLFMKSQQNRYAYSVVY